eukprot:m.278489 g.278489  ORF g.278489 m.278489 type:complete len:214 (+) comp19382_c0_seq13:591-1232(+)
MRAPSAQTMSRPAVQHPVQWRLASRIACSSVITFHLPTHVQGGQWNWHQDYGYWYKDYFLTPDMLTVFLAVDHCTPENGCMTVLKGSHLMGRVDHWSKGDQQGADLERVGWAKQRYEEVICELHPGDCLFFHSNLLHASPGNYSEHRRMALGSSFTRDDNVQLKDAYIPCHPVRPLKSNGQLVADGVVLDSASDKQLLDPTLGVKKARKDEQN